MRPSSGWVPPRCQRFTIASWRSSAVKYRLLGACSSVSTRTTDFTAHLSASRGVWPRPGEHLAVENLLPLGMRRHLGMYKELRSQFYHDKLCCDVSQNPSSRRRCGDWLPVVAKSSVMVLIDGSCQAQLMTPAEVDFPWAGQVCHAPDRSAQRHHMI